MRLIGLTGGIATGKSTVAAVLQRLGATVIDSDQLAREVVEPGRPAYDAVVRRFGEDMLNADRTLDRAKLGALVFDDADARRDLERITHARIGELMQQRIADAFARDAPVVVVDIPLLYEASREDMFEGVLLVYAPRDVQIRRMRERNGYSADEAEKRLQAQLPIDEKRDRATWVIDNSAGAASTEEQVRHWWAEEIAV